MREKYIYPLRAFNGFTFDGFTFDGFTFLCLANLVTTAPILAIYTSTGLSTILRAFEGGKFVLLPSPSRVT